MNLSTMQVLDFVKENDIKFIRLSFIDLDGIQKNLSIMSDVLEDAINHGVVFDGAVAGFSNKSGDLRLVPDLATMHILPWRPQHGRVARFLCEIKDFSGKTVDFDTRSFLKTTLLELKDKGITCELGTDSEFYLFKTDEEGFPTKNTHDSAGYFDIAPLDKGENVRREICLCLEEMGIQPLSSHHEKGPGQNEINFISTDALSSCDNFVIFKSVVKAIASRNGLFASFMPKPIENKNGNGLAFNFELKKDGVGWFNGDKLSEFGENFIAGILHRAKECSLFYNSIPNSYERLGEFEAPEKIEISLDGDRSKFCRFAFKGSLKKLEMRSMDGACNAHLLVALILKSGLSGIENHETLGDFESVELPRSIAQAISEASSSEFLKKTLGDNFMKNYLSNKLEINKEYDKNKADANKNVFERI